MGRAETLTRHLKRHDSELYASRQPTGAIWVLRRNRSRPHEPHFIFALTDNWTAQGRPREWGIEPVLNRIKAHDLWRNADSVVDRILADHEKSEESDRRAARNSIESFLLEFRKPFARATNGINTSTLSKIDNRRKGDLKYGY
jgi:hypothetical protein